MARRPSAASVAPSTPSKSSVTLPASQTFSPSKARLFPSSSSLLNTSSKVPENALQLDPDALFTKHTISDVRAVQLQLRADAEAKQEELRVMVGERYRDLLQASSSIISISKSAQRVNESLEEAKDSISLQDHSFVPQGASHSRKDDTHLQILQKLSAHVKLLLDSPEHLWRLIEQDKYFHAAWLFLLARVVHRTLVQYDGQEDESWMNQGIDVLEQFPLIQRQWDIISHFRTQIVHRATMSLRIYHRPSEDTCATLLTLHLLDSRPLSETLTVFLAQRSKTFSTIFTKPPDSHSTSVPISTTSNSHASIHASHGVVAKSATKPSKLHIRLIKTSIQTAFEVISRTVNTARDVFRDESDYPRSMVSRILHYIQNDVPPSAAGGHASFSTELLLDTKTLLTGLPSSTQLGLLPASISSYKPYVDLDSASSMLPQVFLVSSLDAWFTHAADSLGGALGTWFAELNNVKDVWTARSSLKKWLLCDSNLEQQEKLKLKTIMDKAVHHRILAIWKSVSLEVEQTFCSQISSAIIVDSVTQECSPMEHLFRTPTLPTTLPPAVGPSTSEDSLQDYRRALRQQLNGRTPYLDSVLSTLEKFSTSIQKDMSRIKTGDNDNRDLATKLNDAYQPDASSFCARIVVTLNEAAEKAIKKSKNYNTMETLVFVSRTAYELSLSSPFVTDIGCDHAMSEVFRGNTYDVYDRILTYWLDHTVSRMISTYIHSVRLSQYLLRPSSSGPSAVLIESILSLSTCCHSLGLSHNPSSLSQIARKALVLYSSSFVQMIDQGIEASDIQVFYDLVFLRRLVWSWDNRGNDTKHLDSAIEHIRSKMNCSSNYPEAEVERAASDHLMRVQVLLSTFLSPSKSISITCKDGSDKLSALLTCGSPVIDASFQSVTELAKPSARFGLLLVNTS